MKDLLRIADLTPEDLRLLLLLSSAVAEDPHQRPGLLGGDAVVCYFAKPSTRTRLSFGSAITHLGGVPEIVNGNELQLGRGETIEDTAGVISRYARAFVIRTYADDDVRRFAQAATIPVINALTDGHHPCQALADLLTLRQHFGVLSGLRLAYLGDGNNAAALALENGATVELSHDPMEAVTDADAVYTDVWVSMGDDEDDRSVRSEALAPFQVNEAIMAEAASDAVFMHCLPAHRGQEVVTGVIDGPQSVVLDEAENRMHTAQALLVALLEGRLLGAQGAPVVG